MTTTNEFQLYDETVQIGKDGLKRKMLNAENTVLCECNGTRIDLLRCLSVCSSFGIEGLAQLKFLAP